MKRLISLIILSALLVLTVPFAVAAANANYEIVLDAPETYHAGETITVVATVKNITLSGGISGVRFLLHYDNSVFEPYTMTLAVPCFDNTDFGTWEELSKLDSVIVDGKFVSAENGIINVEACEGGGANGMNHKKAVAGDELVFSIKFTAKSDASTDASFWIEASETECVVLNDSAEGYTLYSGIASGAKLEKTVVFDDPSDDTSSDDTSSGDTSSDDTSSGGTSSDDPSDDTSSDDPSDEVEYTLGDVDGDDDVDADDYILLKRIFFGMAKLDKQANPETALVRSDVYGGDGVITADDYILLKRVFFGMAKLG